MINRFDFVFRLKKDRKTFYGHPCFNITDIALKKFVGNKLVYNKLYGIRIYFNADLPKDLNLNIPKKETRLAGGIYLIGPRALEIINQYGCTGDKGDIDREVICSIADFTKKPEILINVAPTSNDRSPINCLMIKYYLTKLKELKCLQKNDIKNIDGFLTSHNDHIAKMQNEFTAQFPIPTQRFKTIKEGIYATNPSGFFSDHLIREIFDYAFTGEETFELKEDEPTHPQKGFNLTPSIASYFKMSFSAEPESKSSSASPKP